MARFFHMSTTDKRGSLLGAMVPDRRDAPVPVSAAGEACFSAPQLTTVIKTGSMFAACPGNGPVAPSFLRCRPPSALIPCGTFLENWKLTDAPKTDEAAPPLDVLRVGGEGVLELDVSDQPLAPRAEPASREVGAVVVGVPQMILRLHLD